MSIKEWLDKAGSREEFIQYIGFFGCGVMLIWAAMIHVFGIALLPTSGGGIPFSKRPSVFDIFVILFAIPALYVGSDVLIAVRSIVGQRFDNYLDS